MPTYSRFDDPPPYTPFDSEQNAEATAPRPTVSCAQSESDQSLITDMKSRDYRRSELLALIETAASTATLVFGILILALTKVVSRRIQMEPCTSGASLWASVLGIATGALAFMVLRCGNNRKRSLVISHLVMSFVSACGFGALMISSSVCVAATLYPTVFLENPTAALIHDAMPGASASLMVFEICVVLLAITAMITNIVSLAFMCHNWCNPLTDQASAVVYIPTPQRSNRNGSVQSLSVPEGSQVIVLPLASAYVGDDQGPQTPGQGR